MSTAVRRARLYRSSVELPKKLWDDLQIALERRAQRMRKSHGVEVNGTFTAWLREKAQETVNTYK